MRGISGATRVGIEHVDVGDETFAQEAAIVEAPRTRRPEGDHADGLFEREVLPVTHPVGEQMGVDRAVRHLAHVRARIRERHHRARVLHDPLHRLGIEGRDRLHEEAVEVGLERDVDDRLDRIDTTRRVPTSATVGFGGSGWSRMRIRS